MTSTIKVNNIQNQCGANIINENSNTITIGASGDTIALASGASQTGFGRTGTVDWQTTPKTGDFTAANGEGYFVNTTSGAITMTMPSGSAGAIVAIQDYNKTFDSNALTVTPASGEKINGGSADGVLIISTEGQGLTFVYVDATVGWKTVHENEFTQGGSNFISATGGTITTSGNCKIHTFTGPGTFTVCTVAACAANNIVSHLVVAGGGGGGSHGGAGGGAGGFREVKNPVTPYTASPLDGYPSAPNRITVTAQGYPITIGSGGSATGNQKGANGSNSIFSTITSAGGGGGGGGHPAPSYQAAGNGGSGGGGGCNDSRTGGSGNTPPVTPAQGKDGGDTSNPFGTGGGGGATAAGGECVSTGGDGGAGATTSIIASPTAYAGGGGGSKPGTPNTGGGAGGTGGGGSGGNGPGPAGNLPSAGNGTANTGGGGGGNHAGPPGIGGSGGSGIVIIRYKFQ